VEDAYNQSGPFGAYAPDYSIQTLIRLSQWTPLGRGGFRAKMASMVRAGHNGLLDATLFGFNARLSLKDNSSELKALLKPSRYARTAAPLFAKMLNRSYPVIVDIGANAGVFSLLAASKMASGRLVAIEPQVSLFNRLEAHLGQLNPELGDRIDVHLFRCAVGPSSGNRTLSVPRQLGQASLHTLPDADTIEVPVRPLFDIVSDVGAQRIDILKIDIEGFEDEVLIPYFESSSSEYWPEAILLEHCHRARWQRDCETYLLERGYSVESRGRTDMALIRSRA